MSQQLPLFELPHPQPPRFCLFLAIFPDSRTAQNITNFGNAFREKHRLYGKMRPLTHLHVSLHCVGHAYHNREFPLETLNEMCRTVTAVISPFEISFNRILSFRTRTPHPLVLLSDDPGTTGLRRLHESLYAEFTKYAPKARSIPSYTPHVTLLYDKQEIASQPIEPVFWAVKEIILVCSEVGATKYTHLGRWPFGR